MRCGDTRRSGCPFSPRGRHRVKLPPRWHPRRCAHARPDAGPKLAGLWEISARFEAGVGQLLLRAWTRGAVRRQALKRDGAP
eukprot:225101-Prymnesium_polylepis.1